MTDYRAVKFILGLVAGLLSYCCIVISASGQDTLSTPKVGIFLNEKEKAWVAEHPVLRATNYMSWAPLDYFDGEKPAGFSVDYLNLIAEKIGFKIDYITNDSVEEIHRQLKNHEVDIAHALVINEARKEYLNFTSPYLEMPLYFFGRTGSPPIKTIDDLKGRRIGVINGIASATVIKDYYGFLDLVEQQSVVQAFQSLQDGKIDVFTVVLPVANYTISRNAITGVEVIGESVFPELNQGNPIRLAARSDWPILTQILEKGKAQVSDAEFRALSNKWQAEYRSENDIGLTDEEKNWLANNPIIRVVADPTIPPLEFIDQNGRIRGMAGAFLDEIAGKLNVRFEWVHNKNFSDGMTIFLNGGADVISAIVKTEERQKMMNFTESYISLANVIFTRDDSQVFSTMDGLYGHKLAQIKGFRNTEAIRREYPEIEIVEVDTVSDTLRLLATGEVDATVGDILTSSYAIAQEGYTQLIVAGETPYATELSMAISPKKPLLASAMEKAMQSIPASKKVEISSNWLSVKLDTRQNYTLIWALLAGSVVVILLFLIWAFSLKREVARRQRIEEQLKESKAKAQEANKARSNFLANMSHEIRTPLNAIIGFSEVMSSGVYGDIKEEKYREYIKDIKDSGEHLATVVNDILDLTKIDTGKWEIFEEEFDILNCVQDTIKMLGGQAEEKGISLSLNSDYLKRGVRIFADEHAMKRALINLLSNSLKFTKRGGKVICYLSSEEDGALRIVVKDNGIGIPKEKLDHVLIPFGQGHEDHKQKDAGTGLGLPIVKHLAELHQGHFILESEVGVGTTATFWLPHFRVFQNSKSG
ncbi:MAG: transporter substrate-binding domain-containing protein [Alphaproteobacteria bacterium]|nr:transporter substrate-binding domain-containing protein [Alphaproteobacteria bacterium]HPF46442.1 transporter substrate-binding domain-containing protein [Emcibacteraceae bacterium]